MAPPIKAKIEKNLESVDYSFPFSRSRLVQITVAFLMLGLLLHINVVSKMEVIVRKNMRLLPCPVSFSDLRMEMFLPKVVLTEVYLSGACFGPQAQAITLPELALSFTGLSFSPFGPSFKMSTQLFGRDFATYQSVGMNSVAIRLENNTLPLSGVTQLAAMPVMMMGDITISAKTRFLGQQLDELEVQLASKNLVIPKQTISAFEIPQLDLQRLSLWIIRNDDGRLQVRDLQIGQKGSSLQAKLEGDVLWRPQQVLTSVLNINGNLAVSEEVMTAIPLLESYLGKLPQENGGHRIKLQGPLQQVIQDTTGINPALFMGM